MKKRTLLPILTCVLIAALNFVGCGPKTPTDTATKPINKDKVTINQAAKVLLYLPLYIAQDKGFFDQEGIEVKIETGGGDSQAFAAVVGGSADFAQCDPMMVPLSLQNGGPGKIVGNVVARVAFWGVAMDPNIKTIENSKDFAGKRVVTYPAPMTIYALQKRNLLQAGLQPDKDSTIVPAQFGTELAPLLSGKADITMTLEPVVSKAVAQGAHVVYSFPERYGDFTLTGVLTKEDLIRKNPDLVQRVLNAYQRALTYAHQDSDGAIAVAMKEFPDETKSILESAVRRMLTEGSIPKSAVVSKESYSKATSVRRDIGDLTKDVPFDEAVDNKFAEQAQSKFGGK